MWGAYPEGLQTSSSDEGLASYQIAIDELYYLEELPPLSFLQDTSLNENRLDYYAPEIHQALHSIENLLFKDLDFLQISFTDSPNTNAYFDYSRMEIIISSQFVEDIKQRYNREDYIAIIHHVLAHEVSHLIMAIHCEKTNYQISPFLKKCSYSYLLEDEDVNNNLYSYYQTYTAEHLDIDILAFLIVSDLNIDIKPIYKFMKSSNPLIGTSRRISDLFKNELKQRKDFLKNQLR